MYLFDVCRVLPCSQIPAPDPSSQTWSFSPNSLRTVDKRLLLSVNRAASRTAPPLLYLLSVLVTLCPFGFCQSHTGLPRGLLSQQALLTPQVDLYLARISTHTKPLTPKSIYGIPFLSPSRCSTAQLTILSQSRHTCVEFAPENPRRAPSAYAWSEKSSVVSPAHMMLCRR